MVYPRLAPPDLRGLWAESDGADMRVEGQLSLPRHGAASYAVLYSDVDPSNILHHTRSTGITRKQKQTHVRVQNLMEQSRDGLL